MAGGAHPFRLLIVAAEPGQAQAVLKRLQASLPRVRGLFTQDPSKLRALLSEHPCDLILVRLGGVIAAAEVAAVYRETDLQTPMLILDQDGCDPGELVELMAAGACGLIRDLDDGRLPTLVRRWVEQADAAVRLSELHEQATQCSDSSQASIEHCPQPRRAGESIHRRRNRTSRPTCTARGYCHSDSPTMRRRIDASPCSMRAWRISTRFAAATD